MYQKFKGVIAALLTPFRADGSVNVDSIAKLVEHNLAGGVTGFYVGGSTGESMLMTLEERKTVMEAVAEVAKGRATLIGHVGTIHTAHAISLAKVAERCGYDAISAVAPFYYGFSYPAIKGYYDEISASTELPMIIYNFPNSGGFAFTPQYAEEMLKNPKIIGIKHTSADLYTLERFKHLSREIVVYNGFDEMLIAGLTMGADGGIGSTYNVMPKKIVELYNRFQSGDLAGARAKQTEINEIIAVFIKHGVFASEKYMLDHMGIPMGEVRKPFLPLTEEAKADLDKLLPEVVKA